MKQTNKENKALALWKRWFEYSGDPWHESNYGLDISCLFCGEDQPKHEPDCVYVAAKKLACEHERLNDYEDACLVCGTIYVDGKWQ